MVIKIPTIVRVLIGLLILCILILILDPTKIVTILLSINIIYLIPAILVYALTLFILSTRWQKILSDMGIHLSRSEAYSAFVGGLLISDATPGRIGELSRPLLVEKCHQESRTFLSVILDRSMDLVTIILLGIVGILFIIPGEKGKLIWALVVPVLAILVIVALWRSRGFMQKIIQFIGFPPLTRITQKLEEACTVIKNPKKIIVRSVLLTILAWFGHAARFAIIAASLGYSLQVIPLVFILPLTSALSLVPITIAGLGLVEGSLALFLADMSVPLYAGLTIALLDRGVTVAFHVLAGLPGMKKIAL